MSKIFLTSAILFASIFCHSQSIVTFLTSPDYNYYFPKEAKSVTETTYDISFDKDIKPDSTIFLDGVEYNLRVSNSIKKSNVGQGKYETINYDQGGTIISKGYRIFEDGNLIEDVDNYEDDNLKSMSYHKYLSYQNGKLVEIVDKPCSDCDLKSKVILSYDKEKLPKEVFFTNPNIGEMRIVRSKKGEGFRYNYNMVIGEEMKALFEEMGKLPEKEIMPYDEVSIEEDGLSFIVTHYKADTENGTHHLDTKTEMTFEGRIVKEEQYINGELSTAMSYLYDSKGMLISQTDINGTSHQSEFNKEGNYTKKREGYNWSRMDYDAKGNLVKTILTGFNDNLIQMTTFQIVY